MSMGTSDQSQRAAYESWVDGYTSDLYRLAYRLVGQAAAAEDLVQEAFYHAWRSRKSLKDQGKARAWLYQILRYRYAHWVRDRTRRIRTTGIDGAPEKADGAHRQPLDRLADSEELQRALDTLDDRFKLPFLMVFLEGLTCKEAAAKLEIPLGTVLSRIHRARQSLREQLRGSVEQKASAERADASAHRDDTERPRLKLGG